jgi:hypothetical protein
MIIMPHLRWRGGIFRYCSVKVPLLCEARVRLSEGERDTNHLLVVAIYKVPVTKADRNISKKWLATI